MSEEHIQKEPPPPPPPPLPPLPPPEPEVTEPQEAQGGKKRGADKPQKPRKKCAKRAPCWEHYVQRDENPDKAFCKYCGDMIGCDSKLVGTSPMNGHLLRCKPYQDSKGKGKQQVLTGDSKGDMKVVKFDPQLFRRSLNEMVVVNELPFSFVESEGWKRFCSNVLPLYKGISRRTCCRDILGIYEQEREALRKLFSVDKQRVSLTTDIWTCSSTSYSYMVITWHWIDKNWELQKRILSFKVITDHKGETIAQQLMDCLEDWGIERIFTVTVDNARNNDKALRDFTEGLRLKGVDSLVANGEFLHMRCCSHILNLIVGDGLKMAKPSVAAIRNAVKYVRSSFSRLKSFAMRCETGKLCRGSLPLDVVTRWNSTYLMLTAALKLRKAFDKMVEEDKLYCAYFEEDDEKTRMKRVGPPDASAWEEVGRLAKFLKIFYKSTLTFSASKIVTSSLCYNEIVNIERALITKCASPDGDVRNQAHVMRDKFEKYWDGLNNMNPLVIITSVFDPRNKMKFASLCFDQLYGRDTIENKHLSASVSSTMRRIYDEYSSRLAKPQEIEAPVSPSPQITVFDVSDDEDECERMDSIYNKLVEDKGCEDGSSELQVYLTEKTEVKVENKLGMEYDVLSWWKFNSSKFPVLSEFARDVLAVQGSSVASESAFSTSGRVLDPYRSSLTPHMVEVLLCTQQWLRCSYKTEAQVANLAQMLEEFEFFESLDSQNSVAPPP